LAPGTRLATPFHRHQQIEEHFNFHDEDKHAASGTFILRNYRQALDIIREDGIKLDHLASELNTQPADYEKYLESEREYLRNLKTEPPETIETVTYMEALAKLDTAVAESAHAKVNFQGLDHAIVIRGITQK